MDPSVWVKEYYGHPQSHGDFARAPIHPTSSRFVQFYDISYKTSGGVL